MGHTTGAAVKIYQITYIIGFFLGGALHMIVNTIFPVSGLGVEEDFDGVLVVEGEHVIGAGSEDGTSSDGGKGGEIIVGKSVDV